MSDRQVGVVTWVDKNKGFGFIRRHSGDDVVFNVNALSAGVGELSLGQQVSFAVDTNEDTHRALDITAI